MPREDDMTADPRNPACGFVRRTLTNGNILSRLPEPGQKWPGPKVEYRGTVLFGEICIERTPETGPDQGAG